MSAPERIWIAAYDADDDFPLWELISEHAADANLGDVSYTRTDLAAAAEARARIEGWNAAVEAAASLPLTVIPHSPESKALLDALTAYRDAIRVLRKDTGHD